VSFVPGRVRLRFSELKNRAAAESAKARILQTPGIRAVEVNPVTGSILIEYDLAVLPTEKLLQTGKQELEKLGLKVELPAALQ
jgi:copper chaperone CopZ